MRAMVLLQQGEPLVLQEVPQPAPAQGELLLRVTACGICRTDLHVVDGDLTEPALPLVPGHQIVGRVEAIGAAVNGFTVGQRVGVPWLGGSCGHCWYCGHGKENLCDEARYTGYQINGGFAEYTVADANYCFALPPDYDDEQAAPLLCAGLIGYRSYRPLEACETIGFYGFGAAAHIVTQVARHQGRRVFAFTRAADHEAQDFARSLGAEWAGDALGPAPEPLDAAIVFAPVGELVPAALRAVEPAGVVVCAGIHMSDIPSFPYSLLWGERCVRSVANLTRADGAGFMALAARMPLDVRVQTFPLEQANDALGRLRRGELAGAAVLVP